MDLERQFVEYLNYVPYLKGNEKTYSFRLANIILSIGSHIDSAFKEIAIFPEFFNKYPNMLKPKDEHGDPRFPEIIDYYPINSEYSLSERKIMFKVIPKREPIKPFETYKEKGKTVPPWWTNHNKIKHNFNKDNFRLANLLTARDAIAGAFLLNVVHKPAIYRLNEYGLLRPKYQQEPIKQYHIGDYLKNSKPPAFIETEVFFYDYEDNPKYK